MSTIELALGVAVAQQTPPGTVMPVVAYNPLWGVLAGLLVLAVAVYYAIAYLLTRPRPPRPEPRAVPTPPRSVPELQGVYLHEIDSITHRHATGQLTPRRAHAELSRTVREFVAEATGVPTDKMTLQDLRGTPYSGAAYAVAEYYPLVFGVDEATSVHHGADAARQVIGLWR